MASSTRHTAGSGRPARGRSGPKTVYERGMTETMRLSGLAKRIIRAGAARAEMSVGDFHEDMIREYGPNHVPRVQRSMTSDEFPPAERTGG